MQRKRRATVAKMISLEEAAERMGVSYTTAYRLVRRGELPAAKIGKQWRLEPEALEAYIAKVTQLAPKCNPEGSENGD